MWKSHVPHGLLEQCQHRLRHEFFEHPTRITFSGLFWVLPCETARLEIRISSIQWGLYESAHHHDKLEFRMNLLKMLL
jgi:hypothetical protein